MRNEDEDVIVFLEEERLRSLCGVIIAENDNFVILQRRDGTFDINKKFIVKIERHGGGGIDEP